MSGYIIVALVGIVVTCLVAFAINVIVPGGDTTSTEDRLSAMASRRSGSEAKEKSSLLTGMDDQYSPVTRMLEKIPAFTDYLEQADLPMQPAKFILLCVATFVGGAMSCILTPVPILLAPFAGALLTALPISWLAMKRKKRLSKFGRQMPEALDLLSRSLRAGHSLNAGFGLVASELDAPLATEFSRAFEEQNFGIPLDEAIEDMADRIPNMDLRFFATAIVLQRQTGGDLAEILDKISHLIRERLMVLGQVQALTGEGRMSGAVLLALPPVLFLVMLKLNYDYVLMLFTDQIGRYMLTAALITQVIGAMVIKKIITIKV
ncbi:MAG: secretion protein [Planctomycetaceae bacterium TMED240]|nr:secretion protein [Rhodopirellula sp.]OUX09113.1 MAG: secretion protein [Planctomycetaceae bacterium TMED240]